MNKNYVIKMHSATTSAESAKILDIMFKLKKKKMFRPDEFF